MVICGNDNSKVLFSKIEHASIYECRPTNKEIIEIESRFKTLKYAFDCLLDEHCQKREAQGYDDVAEVRYRFMELSGLLDL